MTQVKIKNDIFESNLNKNFQFLRALSPLIVVGMHRSGTSMMVRQLIELGINMGKDLTINSESKLFQQLNRRVLACANASWCHIKPLNEKISQEAFITQQTLKIEEKLFRRGYILDHLGRKQWLLHRMGVSLGSWGWKDPRNSLTLPIWLSVFPNTKVVHMVRNGIDAAISLHQREIRREKNHKDFCDTLLNFGNCFRLWEEYMAACESNLKRLPASKYRVLQYEKMLIDPIHQLEGLTEFLQFDASMKAISSAARIIDPSRLDNSLIRKQYQNEIEQLPESEIMMNFQYGESP